MLPTTDTNEPVVAETYDEVVFTDPTEGFYRQLMRMSIVPKIEMTNQQYMTNFSDNDNFISLIEAQKFLKAELDSVKERFQCVTEDLEQVDTELHAAQETKKLIKAPARKSRPPPSKKAKT